MYNDPQLVIDENATPSINREHSNQIEPQQIAYPLNLSKVAQSQMKDLVLSNDFIDANIKKSDAQLNASTETLQTGPMTATKNADKIRMTTEEYDIIGLTQESINKNTSEANYLLKEAEIPQNIKIRHGNATF